MRKMSAKQRERQSVEHRENGRYAKVNPCYGCGKSAGVDYYSHHLTDTGNWDDAAICLCLKCCNETADMTDVEEFYAYARKKGGLSD
jgi:hypothetical protein